MIMKKIPEHYEIEKRLKEMTGKNVRFGGNYLDPTNLTLFVYLIYRDMDTKKKILIEAAQDVWAKTDNIDDFYEHLKDQVLKAVDEIDTEERSRTPEESAENLRKIEEMLNAALANKNSNEVEHVEQKTNP